MPKRAMRTDNNHRLTAPSEVQGARWDKEEMAKAR